MADLIAAYSVYIVECADGSLYCGIAIDVAARVSQHNSGKRGARYTMSRRPVRLVYREQSSTRSAALKREAAIKRLSRSDKKRLVAAAHMAA
jgi:putative endonuclease